MYVVGWSARITSCSHTHTHRHTQEMKKFCFSQSRHNSAEEAKRKKNRNIKTIYSLAIGTAQRNAIEWERKRASARTHRANCETTKKMHSINTHIISPNRFSINSVCVGTFWPWTAQRKHQLCVRATLLLWSARMQQPRDKHGIRLKLNAKWNLSFVALWCLEQLALKLCNLLCHQKSTKTEQNCKQWCGRMQKTNPNCAKYLSGLRWIRHTNSRTRWNCVYQIGAYVRRDARDRNRLVLKRIRF